MSYTSWFEEHAQKHKAIVTKLVDKAYTKEQIIEYFDFENMLQSEPEFCPLYAENKKCHDMQKLNCYLCACPNFRFDDTGIQKIKKNIQYSFCDIESKDGKQGIYGDKIHQDCSKCGVPHHRSYVEKHFDLEWSGRHNLSLRELCYKVL